MVGNIYHITLNVRCPNFFVWIELEVDISESIRGGTRRFQTSSDLKSGKAVHPK